MRATSCPLAQFAKRARAIGARYAIPSVCIDYAPGATGGPFCCSYLLPGATKHTAASNAYTPEDALGYLEPALRAQYQSKLIVPHN